MSANRLKRWAPLLALTVPLGFALYGVGSATSYWFAIAGLVALVVILWPSFLPRVDIVVLRLLGIVVLGLLVVAGANVLFSRAHDLAGGSGELRLPILWGMLVAVLIFAAVAYCYLRQIGRGKRFSGAGAAILAVLVIAGLPILVGAITASSAEVPPPERVASQLDLLIVGDGSPHPEPPALPPSLALEQFDVSYSVGVADGEGVRWTLVGDPSADAALAALAEGHRRGTADTLAVRKGADSALLLVVDGTAPVNLDPATLPEVPARAGEVARWKRVGAAAAPPGTPVFAVLQTGDRRRLERWRGWSRLEDAVSAQAQSRTAAETALQLAVGSPTAQADFALAMAHRPLLLFDRKEPFPVPLSVDPLFRKGWLTLCHDRGVSTDCEDEPLRDPRQLESGGTHLRIAPPEDDPSAAAPAARAGLESAIYVHPVSVDRGRKHLLYLDYWWYLPGNPVDVGGGALCGAGLVIPGVTCQSHESDWEGLTVVVDRTKPKSQVVAVHYAQHSSVVRYSWKRLRERWAQSDVTYLLPPIADGAGRPLAFVARGTHASYPEPCDGPCEQAASGLEESRHRGNLSWAGNDTDECGRSACLQMLPTRKGGEEPALWNAYTGQWGERHCRFTYYCDSGSPPTAPGNQGRYEDPTQYDLVRVPRPPEH